MFNVGGPEILVIVIVALVVLGPEQLPKAMRTFGNVMGEIRKVSSGFQAEMRNAMDGAATPPREKPHSAKMAAVEAGEEPIDSDGAEVVARSEPSSAADAGAETEGGGEEPRAASGKIDPADRAAGGPR